MNWSLVDENQEDIEILKQIIQLRKKIVDLDMKQYKKLKKMLLQIILIIVFYVIV